MFGELKDWRRINTRYDRCAHTLFSAIAADGEIVDDTGTAQCAIALAGL